MNLKTYIHNIISMSSLSDDLTYIMYINIGFNKWKEIFRVNVKTIKMYNRFCNKKITLNPQKPEDFGDLLDSYKDYRYYQWKIENRLISKL